MMMRKISLILGFIILQLANINAQDGIILDKIIATVGGEILLLSELEENLALAQSQNPSLPENAKCIFLSQLLSQKLLVNQAKLDSLEVTDAEVDGQMNARFDQILAMMNGDPKQFEDYYGITISEAREKLRVDMRNQLLAQRMQREIINSVQITPKEVKQFFNNVPRDSLPYFNAEVEIGEIVYLPKPNDDEEERAKNLANELRAEIVNKGANFSEIASKYSHDFGSARLGGDLGWQKRGEFVPEFEAAAYTMEKGEISEVVKTEFGYHIIQLIERLGNRIHTRHILIQPRITEDDMNLAVQKLEEIKELIETDSITFSQAVKKYSTDKASSYFNNGLLSNPSTGNTFFETAQLDSDIYFAIDTMEVGQVSQPIKFVSDRQEAAFRLVQLVSMTEPHRASLELDYSKIKTAALEEKKAKYTVEWIENTISRTHIKIDEDFKDCEELEMWNNNKRKNP